MVGGEARMGGGARMVVGRGQGLMMAGVWGYILSFLIFGHTSWHVGS